MPMNIKQYDILITLQGTGPDATLLFSTPEGQAPLGADQSLSVQGDEVGDLIVVVWGPGDDQTQITSIRGLPSNIRVEGPDEQGLWFAAFRASSLTTAWSYFASAKHPTNGARAHSHDPEIDNTPPPPLP
jgi:hypothetical protein